MSLGDEIAKLRKSKGLSQKELALLCGVSQPMISGLEVGAESEMKTSTLYRLAEALGVSCDHFKGFFAADEPVELPPKPKRGRPKKSEGTT